MRTLTYRLVAQAFLFTFLWFVLGAIALWSPVPGALGIGGELFAVWLVLFFLLLAVSGGLLTVAALNAAFPIEPSTTRRPPLRDATTGAPDASRARTTTPRPRAPSPTQRES